jgi:hypothetical protein
MTTRLGSKTRATLIGSAAPALLFSFAYNLSHGVSHPQEISEMEFNEIWFSPLRHFVKRFVPSID